VLRRTKFYRPAAPQDLVIRPRLLDKLSQGLSRPLTLVSAPAGYGKTILVSSFLEACALPWTWLSLDKNDNDLRLFLDYLLAALDNLFPGALHHTQFLLAGPTLPPTALIADNLIDELARLEREFILVLDDVHEVRNPETYNLFAALLDHPLPGLHLLLVTRQDPPLGLGMLRARDQMTEIRSQDLRFTTGETGAFMAHTTATPLPEEALAILNERTEGWATGLRLAALTLHYGGEIDPKVAELHAANRYVFDYLLHEVLAHTPPAIEDFLVKTSILDTLCGPLCDAVMAADGEAGRGQSYLQMLEETDLFTVALDEQGFWYRYHHLFQGLLRSRLTRKLDAHAIDALHGRASAWYASHDLPEAALEHALAGHDLASAVQLVAQHRHHLLDTEQRPRLQRWLRAFPEGAVAHSPELLLAKAWSAAPGRADSHTVLAQVDRAQTLIEQMTGAPARARQLQGEIDTLRSIEMGFAANNPQGVIALTTRALEVMPQEWYWARATAWLQLAIAYQLAGQLERAYTVLAEGQLEDTAVIHAPRVRVAGAGALIDWMAGDLSRFIQTSQTVISISHAANLHESLGFGHYFLATACYQRNNLAAAEQHANIVKAQRYVSDPIAVAQSAFILAMVHQARGRPEAARQMLVQVNDYLLETHSQALLPGVQAFGAELAAVQGDFATAGEWAATVGPLLPFSIMAFFYAPQLALPRILIRLDTPASRRQAAAALARVEAFVTATHNTRYMIDVLALQALCAAAEGNAPVALQSLEQAVRLAQPGGFIRVFVDLGPAMAELLERLARRSAAVDYIRQILEAFPSGSAPFASAPSPSRRSTTQPDLVEPLSNRELEVMALLALRLSAKEIAQRLIISERTAKRHTANIYQKLGVNNRREAVTTAIALGILPAGQ
jgi:LuxR family maltose regulon positive regulatory protein